MPVTGPSAQMIRTTICPPPSILFPLFLKKVPSPESPWAASSSKQNFYLPRAHRDWETHVWGHSHATEPLLQGLDSTP